MKDCALLIHIHCKYMKCYEALSMTNSCTQQVSEMLLGIEHHYFIYTHICEMLWGIEHRLILIHSKYLQHYEALNKTNSFTQHVWVMLWGIEHDYFILTLINGCRTIQSKLFYTYKYQRINIYMKLKWALYCCALILPKRWPIIHLTFMTLQVEHGF